MRSPRKVLTALIACALATPGAAAAEAPKPKPKPKPAPAAGQMSLRLKGGLSTRKVRHYAYRQRITVVGTVRQFVPGQAATVSVIRRRRASRRVRVPIVSARGGRGRFVARFALRGTGVRRIVAKRRASAGQARLRAESKPVKIGRWSAVEGSRGVHVLLLQRGLQALGYATPVTGYFDSGTGRAVLAFRKAAGWARNGYASPGVFGLVFRRRGAFPLRYPRAGKHVEFDWSRQLLVLANRGRPARVYHASSGKSSTPTVFGTFRFYLKTPGTNAVGMVNSNYFIGGYAIHGYASVPNYPASHGCIRVPIPNADEIYRMISIGERIFVYG